MDVLASQARPTELLLCATPVPDTEIVAGELVALLATVTVPFTAPAVVGAKDTLRVAV